jgi:hypothetical protein
MDDLGAGMTDPKPLVQVRNALARLKVSNNSQSYLSVYQDYIK